MKAVPTALADVKVLVPNRFPDDRGYVSEVWNQSAMAALGLNFDFVQDNESFSASRATVRGLHYQAPPYAQAKLIRVVTGAILDIAVDVRKGSPDYGRAVAVELSSENGHQILVPRGFLHGFVTLQPNSYVIYKVDNYYAADCAGAVAWNDPDLAINWGVPKDEAIVSAKDTEACSFSDWVSPFDYEPPA